jgi:hypothetical protein
MAGTEPVLIGTIGFQTVLSTCMLPSYPSALRFAYGGHGTLIPAFLPGWHCIIYLLAVTRPWPYVVEK